MPEIQAFRFRGSAYKVCAADHYSIIHQIGTFSRSDRVQVLLTIKLKLKKIGPFLDLRMLSAIGTKFPPISDHWYCTLEYCIRA